MRRGEAVITQGRTLCDHRRELLARGSRGCEALASSSRRSQEARRELASGWRRGRHGGITAASSRGRLESARTPLRAGRERGRQGRSAAASSSREGWTLSRELASSLVEGRRGVRGACKLPRAGLDLLGGACELPRAGLDPLRRSSQAPSRRVGGDREELASSLVAWRALSEELARSSATRVRPRLYSATHQHAATPSASRSQPVEIGVAKLAAHSSSHAWVVQTCCASQ